MALPFAIAAFLCVLFIREVPLRETILRADEIDAEAAAELPRGSGAPMTPRRHLRQLEAEVGVLIRRVRRVIGERARAVHADLQPSSYLLLAYVDESGPARASALADSFGIDKGAISRQVQHLVDLGLVERTPDPEDGRALLVAATAEASARLAEVSRHRRKRLDERLGDWDDADLAAFVAALQRYNQTLTRSCVRRSADPRGGVGRQAVVRGRRWR